MDSSLTQSLKHPIVIGGLAANLFIGAGLGYFLGSRRRREVIVIHKKEESAQLELDLTYKTTVDEDGNMSTMVEDIQLRKVEEDPPTKAAHPFVQFPNDDWDMEAEEAARDDNEPYVIHVDEYLSNESGFPQQTVTWFQMDDILCDEQDAPVYNYKTVLGELKFGHGSGDPNVVYIRNVSRKQEFEVLFSSNSYESEVLGLKVEEELGGTEFKHSLHRFRQE